MAVTYPLLQVVDDSGAIVTGATVTITSVTDKAGSAIASHGATVNVAGSLVSVDYDAEAKGEAWVTLAISKVGSTFTGTNAAPGFYLARDSARVLAAINSSGQVALSPAGLDAVLTTEPTVAVDGPMATWNFRKLLRWVAMRFARAGVAGSSLTVSTLDGSPATVQAVAGDSVADETVGPPQ